MNPKHIYDLYKNNINFKTCLVDTLISAKQCIEENFPGVKFNMYGRIKSENSFMKKNISKNHVYDIYAFKIVVVSVPDDYTSDNPEVATAKNKIAQSVNPNNSISKNLIARDDLNIAVARDIADFLVENNSPFLNETNARHLEDRRDHHRKSNGYISEHFTIVRKPNNSDIDCRIEAHVLSDYRNTLSKENHSEYKDLENRPEESQIIVKQLLKCKTIGEFDELCKSVPTYFLCRSNGDIIELSRHASILHFCSKYLFMRDNEENKFRYQRALDVVNKMYSDNILLYKSAPDGASGTITIIDSNDAVYDPNLNIDDIFEIDKVDNEIDSLISSNRNKHKENIGENNEENNKRVVI